jgi:hypothetical protein
MFKSDLPCRRLHNTIASWMAHVRILLMPKQMATTVSVEGATLRKLLLFMSCKVSILGENLDKLAMIKADMVTGRSN